MIKIDLMPDYSGVYLMKDFSGEIIYIGKANNLKKRISSYFSNTNIDFKTNILLSEVKSIDYIITNSEVESLILEKNLIRKLNPKYNVMWKDDKSYPYLKLSLEKGIPKLSLVRLPPKQQNLVKNINKTKPIQKNIYYGPFPKLKNLRRLIKWIRQMFLIENIERKSIKNISLNKEKYNELKFFLKGEYDKLKQKWQKQMNLLSRSLNFEDAAKIRDNIYSLDSLFQNIKFRKINELELKSRIETFKTLSELKEIFQLPKVPLIIEGFDVSNFGRGKSVGSMVRFKNAKPDKNNYRIFNIKSTEGIDDYSKIAEIVQRRYQRLLNEKKELPDLIIIDGGKGHFDTGLEVLKKIKIRIPVLSIAKENEEIFCERSSNSVILPKDSSVLQLVQYVRDESHRFAIKNIKKSYITHNP